MMNINQPLIASELKVDLAFSGCIPIELENQIDEETKNILTSLDTWTVILNTWINFIRSDNSLICPEIVRSNNLLSLGLIFTDDLYISKLNKKWRNKNQPTDVLSFPAFDGNFE